MKFKVGQRWRARNTPGRTAEVFEVENDGWLAGVLVRDADGSRFRLEAKVPYMIFVEGWELTEDIS